MSAAIKRRRVCGKLPILMIAVILAAALTWYVKHYVSMEDLVAQEERIREVITQRPWRSFALGFVIYALVSLVPGTSGKSIIFGWLYGVWQGALLIIMGLSTAAMAIFYLSRYVCRGWIEHRYERFLTALNRHLKKEGAFYLITLRMAHFPFSIINLASGASRVHAWTFYWTTVLGLLPGTAVFAYVGARLPSLDQLIANGPGSLVDTPLIVALSLSAVFPFIFRKVARRAGILKDTGSPADLATIDPRT